MLYLGEVIALTTATLWAVTTLFFGKAGERIGSFNVNKIRLVMAVIIYTSVLMITRGYLFSDSLNSEQVLWLALSGVVGLVLGDSCLFKALVMIGPRLTTLLYSSAPIFATITAWILLDEQLSMMTVLGIIVTLGGITWVVAERQSNNAKNVADHHPDAGSMFKGILLGLGGGAGQGIGLVLAKYGMAHSGEIIVEPMEASYIRMVASVAVIWTFSGLRGQLGSVFTAIRNKKAMAFCAGGAICGPFLGVWCSLIAVSMISAGVATTLNSTVPVMILPLVYFVNKEKISFRAILGTIVTVLGVAILFWN